MPELCGVLPLDKPAGVTSHDMVGFARRLFGTRRVGHTGTLDPMATGVLILLIGRAAKAAEYLTAGKKRYEAILRLGVATDTEDITGKTLTVSGDIPESAAVLAAAARYRGRYLQTPPMVSALKVNGQKLVDLARRGVEVERAAREVEIYDLDCRPLSRTDYALSVTCSAGTYIRTLCADIGRDLGCGGVMAALRRTETGGLTLADCHTKEALEAMDETARAAALLPVETLFAALPAVRLSPFFERLARGGCELYQKKLGTAYPAGTRVRLQDEKGSFFALGEVRDYADGSAVKAIKLFTLSETCDT